MKKATIILLVILNSIVGASQTSLVELRMQYERDTEDVSTLLELADYFKTENVDSLNFYVLLLADIAGKSSDQTLLTKGLLKQVEGYLLFNRFDEADSLLGSISIGEKASPSKIDYLVAKGKILNSNQENDKALEAFYAALDLNNDGQLNYLIPEIYAEIASVLRENNDLENCTKYYRFALEEARKSNNVELQVKVCVQMCKVYNGWITLNLDSSVYYGELGMKIAREADYEYGYVNAISILSAPIIRNGEYRRGLEMSREALSYVDEYNLPLKTRYYLVLNQGFAFQEMSIYDSALIIMREAAQLRPESIDHFRLEYLIHKEQGKYEKALSAYEIYKAKADSIKNGRNSSKLSSEQARYEANLKEQEVMTLTQTAELQNLQLSQQRFLTIGFGTLALFLLAGAILVSRQRQLRTQQKLTSSELAETQSRLELEQQTRAAELKAIRSQMNPHFVFNALNSIQEYIMTNERKLAGKYLGKFADLMRVYLQHSQVKTVTLREEVEALSLYLELEKLRFEDSLTYSFDIKNDVDMETPIPSLLIQPYVENAIKHGLLHKQDDRQLTIEIEQDDRIPVLQFQVTDNGIGRKKSREINGMRNPNHKPFATQATKSRIELLNHDREQPIVETITDFKAGTEHPGTKVLIELPITSGSLETENRDSEIEV